MLTVHVHAADVGGCGHYRMIWPANTVASAGLHHVALSKPEDPESHLQMQLVDDEDGVPHVVGLNEVPECDVLVLQRPLSRLLADSIPHLQRAGVAVVVEVDDDFHSIHRNNRAWRDVQPRVKPDSNWQHLMRACDAANVVTVTTPALARRYGRRGNARIIANYLPPMWFEDDLKTVNDEIIVGWSGSVASHPTDLRQVGNVVAKIASEDPRVGVCVVGTGVGVATAFGLPTVRASGWQDIEKYPTAMGMLDVGLVPLDITPFNHAKSHLKGLEFAACGVPFVASPTDPYLALERSGIGYTARNHSDWYKRLHRLVSDSEHRQEVGWRWRSLVMERWAMKDHPDLWADAWTAARDDLVSKTMKLAGRYAART